MNIDDRVASAMVRFASPYDGFFQSRSYVSEKAFSHFDVGFNLVKRMWWVICWQISSSLGLPIVAGREERDDQDRHKTH